MAFSKRILIVIVVSVAAFATLSMYAIESATAAQPGLQYLKAVSMQNIAQNQQAMRTRILGKTPTVHRQMTLPAGTVRGQRPSLMHGGNLNHRGPIYFVTVYDAKYRRPGESNWRLLGTYENQRDANFALYRSYDRGYIPPGSQMEVVSRRRPGTPPPETVTRYFIVYRPPGQGQRELGPYNTRRDADLVLLRAYERGQIPSGSYPTVQEREIPVR